MKALAIAVLLSATPADDPWFGPDKVKHFLLSAFVHSVAYSGARSVGLERGASQVAAGGAALAVGVWKEVRDRRDGGRFSPRDLGWDAAGALAAAALLNGAR